ncbi:adenylate kinase 9-like [Anthonomus grandis grandis]|uniref:adenylate kinase 9-like n=1 Tax=Anthonomus grandis grandis TaxID=2921223 RepID=UPI002166A078|nr:adenylate kinase 9-like [Anthonomus grandis grandis]
MSSTTKIFKQNSFISQNQDIDELQFDQTVILNEAYISKVPFVEYIQEEEQDEPYDEVYPFVNSYYSHIEDADPLSKVNAVLAKPEILENQREKYLDLSGPTYDAYSERDAQIRYLQSRPLCFIILGKPDIGQQELGRELANFWKCVYIEPQTLIEEEIESGSKTGECIDFNLRLGRAVGIDVILKLVKKKVESATAKHRGFVLCGLPVISNDLYQDDPVTTESAIFAAKEVFQDIFDKSIGESGKTDPPPGPPSSKPNSEHTSTQGGSKNTESSTQGNSTSTMSDQETTFNKNYQQQLDFLFALMQDPYFIIYIHCGTMDVLSKRDSYRFDVTSREMIDLQRRRYNSILSNLPEEERVGFVDDTSENDLLNEEFRLSSLVKLPRDFKANVSTQLDQYYYVAFNFIQDRILAHSPEYYLRVDGRTCITRMFSIIKSRLQVMNVQPALIPYRLIDPDLEMYYKTVTILGEDPDGSQADPDESKNVTPEECFKQFRRRHAPSESYLWSLSPWEVLCPVSMTMGRIIKGSAKYPVQFMNKIFFLADEEAYKKFYENPRPYLLPPYPRTTCRIFIFGPKLSGRTALSHCLAYYLDATVLSVDKMLEQFMKQRQGEYLEQLRKKAIQEGIALLNQKRKAEVESLEKERVEKIKEWVKAVIELLQQMSAIQDELEREEKKEKLEISSFPMAMKRVQTADVIEDSEQAVALSKIREQLQEMCVPIYKLDIPVWKSYITERKKLLQHLPAELAQKHHAQPANQRDQFVKDYVNEVLANAGLDSLQITGGSIRDMFIEHILEAEESFQKKGYGPGGWIIDGMMLNLKILQDFAPDYLGDDVIVLRDDGSFLENNFKERTSTFFRDYKGFFKEIGLDDVAWRCASEMSTQSYKEGMAKGFLTEILEHQEFYDPPDDDSLEPRVIEYKINLERFTREWRDIERFYLEHQITPIEIDLAGKSLPELFHYTIKTLEAKYNYKAKPLTEEDRAEEVMTLDHSMSEHFGEEDTTLVELKPDVSETLRKYGETLDFCPVSFIEHFVLWRGKEDFAVKYNEKVFLMATAEDMQKFLADPLKYLPQGYTTKFPPLRVCVLGVSGCGKSRVAKKISENYGLIYLDYDEILKNHFGVPTEETLFSTKNPLLLSYLNSQSALPKNLTPDVSHYWLKEPFRTHGIVLDNFPKTHFDVDLMIAQKLIPDVILYLQADDIYLKTKILDMNLKTWQEEMEKQRIENEQKHSKALERWREKRSLRFNELIEERREVRYNTAKVKTSEQAKSDTEDLKGVSLVSFDSVADQQDIDEVNKILDNEFPAIIYDTPVEQPEVFISKTEPVIYSKIQADIAAISLIRDKCLRETINFQETPLNLDHIDKTEMATFLMIDPLKFRSFEACYEVSLEMAEQLLSLGYMFLSKFGKFCPVQYYNQEIPYQMYRVAEDNGELYAIIHRSYIYFIVSAESKELFKKDPLKYINVKFNLPLLSYKVAVTGPPKCGKTTLCQRIRRELGFEVVSRGQAARYVLKYLFQSDLAKNMESVLRKGWELTDEMVIRSVEAATITPKAITQGVVFDGFPNNLNETRHLAYMDLVPNLVIDLIATKNQVAQCLSNDTEGKNGIPKLGRRFICHLYAQWANESSSFRKWFDEEYQATVRLPIDKSLWDLWNESKKYILSTIFEINHYYKNIMQDWPLRLGNLLVTPLEFIERQSAFKSYCPVCLHLTNSLLNGGEPPDRTGVVQYRNHFYWICQEHIEVFLKTPELYLPPYNKHKMPPSVPKKVTFIAMPLNVYENGACAVCYKIQRILTEGKLTLAVTYDDKVYLFDTKECFNDFMRSPTKFLLGIEFKAPNYPELKYRELPILGLLEQYVAKYIVQGLCQITKRRPVLPGLSISASALIGLGLFLKVKNEQPSQLRPYYEEGMRLYNQRRENLIKYLDMMKYYRNPYVHYEEPLPPFVLPPPTPKTPSVTTVVSRIVDECVDNMKFFERADSYQDTFEE